MIMSLLILNVPRCRHPELSSESITAVEVHMLKRVQHDQLYLFWE